MRPGESRPLLGSPRRLRPSLLRLHLRLRCGPLCGRPLLARALLLGLVLFSRSLGGPLGPAEFSPFLEPPRNEDESLVHFHVLVNRRDVAGKKIILKLISAM